MTTQPKNNFVIKSTKVILKEFSIAKPCIIYIKNDKFSDVIYFETLQEYQDFSIDDSEVTEVINYGNEYIIPGLIDINSHLNSTYDVEWQDVGKVTKLAAQTGTTTLIDSPIMLSKELFGVSYTDQLLNREKSIEGKCYIDIGLLSFLPSNVNMEIVKEILGTGCIGFKGYYSTVYQENLNELKNEDLALLIMCLDEIKPYKTLSILIHSEKTEKSKLFISSPFRNQEPQYRLSDDSIINKNHSFDGFADDGYIEQNNSNDANNNNNNNNKVKVKVKKPNDYFKMFYFEVESPSDSDEQIEVEQETQQKLKEKEKEEKVKQQQKQQQQQIWEEPNSSELLRLIKKNREKQLLENISETEKLTYQVNEEQIQKKSPKLFNFSPCYSRTLENKVIRQEESSEEQKIQLSLPSENQINLSNSFPDKVSPVTKQKDSYESLFEKKEYLNNSQLSIKIELSQDSPRVANEDTFSEMTKAQNSSNMISPLSINIRRSRLLERRKLSYIRSKNQSENNIPVSPRQEYQQVEENLVLSKFVRSNTGTSDMSDKNMNNNNNMFSNVGILQLKKIGKSSEQQEMKLSRSYQSFLSKRPYIWEEQGVRQVLKVLKQYQSQYCNIVLTNLANGSSIYALKKYREQNEQVKIYCDSSVVYMCVDSSMSLDGQTKYKNSQPIRDKDNRNILLKEFIMNYIDSISSFHIMVPPSLKNIKNGDFRKAFNGFNSIGCTLSALWSTLYLQERQTRKKLPKQKKAQFDQEFPLRCEELIYKIIDATCYNPAKILGIDHIKGSIQKGKQADFVIWKPYQWFKFEKNDNLIYPDTHVFHEKKMYGLVCQTYLRGQLIYNIDNLTQPFHYPSGVVLKKNYSYD